MICVLVCLFSSFIFGQAYTKHTVAKNETVTSIAQKYNVTPYDIYKLNPDSQNGIEPGATLIIPKGTAKAAQKPVSKPDAKPAPKTGPSTARTHIVQPKETIYSILKRYNLTEPDLLRDNPFLKAEGLQPGQKLVINHYEEPPKMVPAPKNVVVHEVQPKETKYGIATKYGITVEALENQNPEIKDNLPVGHQLKISGIGAKKPAAGPEIPEKMPETKSESIFEYTVKSGETLYSLTRQFNITQEKLTALNPELKDGVKEGMVLKLPASVSYAKASTDSFADLAKTLSRQERKEMVLLLPFNISKIESDTLTSVANRLKKDKFLNMTLDFYSGALMAIDSAKVLGLNINVKIFDSQETKSASNAVNIVRENAQNAHLVIGPFYQDNVEKVAEALQEKNIPVISPLSKEYDKSYKNLYQSTPNNELLKSAMFDFMKAKNGNIIAVVDPKKPSIKAYLAENQPMAKLVGLTDKGGFTADSIRKHFVADRVNFVVMESENYYTINTTLNAMTAAMKDHQVQLVVLESNPMLDNEEIALSRLTKVKMTYPSATRENESAEAVRFEKLYKKKNKVLPNQYAVRGFDLVFDAMLRLSQEKSFEETARSVATEQVENKFDYGQKVAGGFINNGVYILYYNTDLTIKQEEQWLPQK